MTPSGNKKGDRLARYRAKRSPERTTEPFEGSRQRPRLFVVQKHAARRMHYDLRLEFGGVLHSWAVPKGPSFDPQVKRLAVEVEEHPLDYGDFEGLIPDGNYGAGAVIVWDRGQWEPIGDPDDGLETGKLLFDLKGYKLRGRWTLFRTSKGAPNEWLMMKKPDAYADPDAPPGEESIHSGLTVEEVRDGVDPADKLRRALRRMRAPTGDVPVETLAPMLAQRRDQPFTKEGWLFEIKYDGYRMLAAKREGAPLLRYRRGQDVTNNFPELAQALRTLPFESIVMDGELVVLDDLGRPSFQRLQGRVRMRRTHDIGRATVEQPATLFLFDLLAFEDRDLRSLPLVERKKLLAQVLPRAGPLRYCDHVPTEGEAMFEQVRQMRLEGIVAKRADSPYRSTRSADWLKIRADRTGDFAIAGFSPAKGAQSGFGALHLAVREGDGWEYAGRVGSGFSAGELDRLSEELAADRRADPPCTGEIAHPPRQTWVEPTAVCEVRFKEWTGAGHLRHPVFLRMREDKAPEDCVREGSHEVEAEPLEATPPVAPARTLSLTNLDKIFWPEEGYTKGDLIDYYRRIGPWLLPYLEDRPLVLTRYPDGINGKSFFQKDAPGYVPDWIRTEMMWSEHAQREIHYFICDDLDTLVYLINMGTIPLHLWSSRISSLQNPDWSILDLDPKEAPFADVIRIARRIRELCQTIDLPCFVKTSGSSGLHVLIPLGGQCTYEESRTLAELMARLVATELPEIATIIRSPRSRGGRVYIDYVQNGHGRLLVSPFCVRPLPVAPVSAPLRWSEVRKGLTIERHTIRSVPRRMKRLGDDPLRPVLDTRPDLASALELLSRLVADN